MCRPSTPKQYQQTISSTSLQKNRNNTDLNLHLKVWPRPRRSQLPVLSHQPLVSKAASPLPFPKIRIFESNSSSCSIRFRFSVCRASTPNSVNRRSLQNQPPKAEGIEKNCTSISISKSYNDQDDHDSCTIPPTSYPQRALVCHSCLTRTTTPNKTNKNTPTCTTKTQDLNHNYTQRSKPESASAATHSGRFCEEGKPHISVGEEMKLE